VDSDPQLQAVAPIVKMSRGMNTMGGASGGPVFDERGLVFAVVSSGFDESTTYVAPVKDLALAKIYRAEPPRGDGSMLNLLEYFEKY